MKDDDRHIIWCRAAPAGVVKTNFENHLKACRYVDSFADDTDDHPYDLLYPLARPKEATMLNAVMRSRAATMFRILAFVLVFCGCWGVAGTLAALIASVWFAWLTLPTIYLLLVTCVTLLIGCSVLYADVQ